jgi:hypothetical protein
MKTKMLVMKYTIVVSENMYKPEKYAVFNQQKWDRPCLIELVQIRIKDGWVPLGGVSFGDHEEFEEPVWAQAMVKDSEEE